MTVLEQKKMDQTIKDKFLDQKEIAEICKALSHPIRIRIIEHLKTKESCICGEIVDIFTYSQSTISQHLKQLKKVGLIKGEVEGPRTCYCLDYRKLKQFKDAISLI